MMRNQNDWRRGEKEIKRSEAFEMWCYRRMINIKWMDRITNEEVLERIGERRTLWKSLRKRRGQIMGYTLRHGGMLRYILEGERWERKVEVPEEDILTKYLGIWDARHLKRSWVRVQWRRVVVSNLS